MAASLDFVHKNAGKETNYREDQKELIEKALEVANGDELGTLQYIVSCLAHENINVEFEIEYRIRYEYTISLPIIETEPKEPLGFYVVWGDGTITHNETIHTYESDNKPVNYQIRFFGLGIKQFGDNSIFGRTMTKIISFGDLGHTFTSLAYACAYCFDLESVPLNIPRTVTDLSYMFKNCTIFNQSIDSWDTSNITNMSHMFEYCYNFNQSIDKWDVSKVTNMSYMFSGCYRFNQTLNSWDTGSARNMSYMFSGCDAFNQILDKWNVNNVEDKSNMFVKESNRDRFESLDF